jgi:hypothetical protein
VSFQDSNNAGNKIIAAALQSPNYAQGASGWTINRDGSAEFQNVLVRGTITASTIIGSTITGGTIIGGDIRSNNYVAGTSGFDLNGNTNQIEINTGFRVGGASSANIQLLTNGTRSEIDLHSNTPGETAAATVFAQPDAGGSGRPVLVINSPKLSDGAAQFVIVGGATGQTAGVILDTQGVAAVGGVTGQFIIGDPLADVWQVFFNNSKSVFSGAPGVVIGDGFTPGARQYLSQNESLAITGGNVATTLFVNCDATQTTFAPIVSTAMRPAQVTSAGSASVTSSTYTRVFGGTADIILTTTPSATVSIHIEGLINPGTAGTDARLSYEVRTNPGNVVVVAASDANCAANQNTNKYVTVGSTNLETSLTANTSYRVNLMMRSDNTHAATIFNPRLIVGSTL